ncbi:MAG: adenosylcobinamide-GDP ribazoletransferase [Proteobacteria bacterium]|nr:adenosylcobinamide-GDP ribazoletransferase [Pseudomonadota bacterium]
MSAAVRELRLFLTALGFLTRLPVPAWVGWSPEQQAASARHLPTVGWLVGALQALVLLAAAGLWPPAVAAWLAVAAGLLMTGVFHEDGLADACDGLGGGTSREHTLAIMKDSRIGSYGTAALVVALALKAQLLAALLGPQGWDAFERVPAVVLTLVAAHAASRWTALLVMQRLPYVREEGSGKFATLLLAPLSRPALLWATAVAVLPLLLLGRSAAWLLVPALLGLAWWATVWLRRRLGGCTGDTLGAVQQVAELLCLLALTALAWA